MKSSGPGSTLRSCCCTANMSGLYRTLDNQGDFYSTDHLLVEGNVTSPYPLQRASMS